jgi:NitT/TauT family transport system substrate-binding protein
VISHLNAPGACRNPVRSRRGAAFLAAISAVALLAASCGGDAEGAGAKGEGLTLRIGYFPNVTHASAIVGLKKGVWADSLGENVTIESKPFNAGGDAIESLFSGAIDASFLGPNPAITGFAESNGEALRIVSGATSGGAFLVVKPEIKTVENLRGKKISSPDLGNTQDVALRAWLAEQGLETDPEGGGDVSILPQENAQIFETFASGEIDGAWVPEPWATRMIEEGDGTVLVDEADLWPDGQFVTTHLIVATSFLEDHPDVVKNLLEGHVAATDFANENPEESQQVVIDSIEEVTGAAVGPETIAIAWKNLEFTVDPVADSLRAVAEDAAAVDLLDPVDLNGIYDLSLLNEILTEQGRDEVQD